MIAHLILMKLTDPDDGNRVAQEVRSLAGRIPGMLAVDGGQSVVENGTTWQLGFVMLFSDVDHVRSYQSHPAHVAVAQVIRPLIASMATSDIEITRQSAPAVFNTLVEHETER